MDKREEIYQRLVAEYKGQSGIYDLSPRLGKTRIGIGIIKKIEPMSILWVTPSTKLRDEDIPNEFSKWKAKKYLKRLTAITWSSLKNETGIYDIIFLDELQKITSLNSKNLFNGKLKGKKIIALTGTLSKDDEKKELIKRLGLGIIETITVDNAVDDEIIADYQINVVECNLNTTDKNVKAGSKANSFLQTEASAYLYKDKQAKQAMFSGNPKYATFRILDRRRFIMDSPTKEEIAQKLFNSLGKRVIMFTTSIKQCERMSKHTYHSKTDNTDIDKFQAETIKKIALVESGGIGYTYKNVDHFILMQASSDKNGDTSQKILRSALKQKDYKAQIWIISLLGTQDETWVSKALSSFNADKIKYVNVKNIRL